MLLYIHVGNTSLGRVFLEGHCIGINMQGNEFFSEEKNLCENRHYNQRCVPVSTVQSQPLCLEYAKMKRVALASSFIVVY